MADSTRLSSVPFIIQPAAPLSAKDDENLVCVELMTGDTLRADWAIAVRGGQPAHIHAELTLLNGDVVPLPTASMSAAQYCLGPKIGGPLPSAVREVRVSSSTPIVVASIGWVSTHK